MDTQDFLQKKVWHLFQKSYVSEVDPKDNIIQKEVRKYDPDPGKNDEDAKLVHLSTKRWEVFETWPTTHQ